MDDMPQTCLVVPCFNEAERLPGSIFLEFAKDYPNVHFLFVDDGSLDHTLELLEGLCQKAPRQLAVLPLENNQGKAEAVRQGVLKAIESEYALIGFWDADLATPLEELSAFIDAFAQKPQLECVIGSRVALLGRDVRRKAIRHYLGRVFATVSSAILGFAVYDTQCGAKVMRNSDLLKAVWAKPFLSRWIFDVEVLMRYRLAFSQSHSKQEISSIAQEQPLLSWRDVQGSKLRPKDFLTVLRDLWNIHRLARGVQTKSDSSSSKP